MQTQNLREKAVFGFLILYALSTLISMAAMSLGLACLGMAFVLMADKRERFRDALRFPECRTYLLVSALLVGSALLSVLSAAFFPLHYQHESVGFGELRKLSYFLVPLVFVMAARDYPVPNRMILLRAFWLLLGIMGAIGLQQYFTGWPRREGINIQLSGRFAAVLGLGLSLSVASLLSIAFFPLVSRLFDKWKKKPNGCEEVSTLRHVDRIAFLLPASLLVATTIFLTFSRMAWIGLAVGGLVALSVWFRGKMILVAIPLLVIVGTAFVSIPSLKLRLAHPGGYSDRLMLWEGHLELFRLRPISGVGWRQNGKLVSTALQEKRAREGREFPTDFFASHGHNMIIDTLASTGLVGLMVFVLWNAWFIRFLFRMRRGSRCYGFLFEGALLALFVLHVNGLTQVNFWDAKVFHQILLLVSFCLFMSAPSLEKKTP